jgi:hypothetical protein
MVFYTYFMFVQNDTLFHHMKILFYKHHFVQKKNHGSVTLFASFDICIGPNKINNPRCLQVDWIEKHCCKPFKMFFFLFIIFCHFFICSKWFGLMPCKIFKWSNGKMPNLLASKLYLPYSSRLLWNVLEIIRSTTCLRFWITHVDAPQLMII